MILMQNTDNVRSTKDLDNRFYGDLMYLVNEYHRGRVPIKKIVDLIGLELESLAYDEEPERYTALVKRGVDDYIISSNHLSISNSFCQ